MAFVSTVVNPVALFHGANSLLSVTASLPHKVDFKSHFLNLLKMISTITGGWVGERGQVFFFYLSTHAVHMMDML